MQELSLSLHLDKGEMPPTHANQCLTLILTGFWLPRGSGQTSVADSDVVLHIFLLGDCEVLKKL